MSSNLEHAPDARATSAAGGEGQESTHRGMSADTVVWIITVVAVVVFWLVATSWRPWQLFDRAGFSADFYDELYDEVKDRVREDLIRTKATELSRQRATAIAAALKSSKDFAAAAKAQGVEAKDTELVPRGSALPDIGVSPEVDRVAFTLPAGCPEVSKLGSCAGVMPRNASISFHQQPWRKS